MKADFPEILALLLPGMCLSLMSCGLEIRAAFRGKGASGFPFPLTFMIQAAILVAFAFKADAWAVAGLLGLLLIIQILLLDIAIPRIAYKKLRKPS